MCFRALRKRAGICAGSRQTARLTVFQVSEIVVRSVARIRPILLSRAFSLLNRGRCGCCDRGSSRKNGAVRLSLIHILGRRRGFFGQSPGVGRAVVVDDGQVDVAYLHTGRPRQYQHCQARHEQDQPGQERVAADQMCIRDSPAAAWLRRIRSYR